MLHFGCLPGFDNFSAFTYNQPFRKITYGMLINVDSNTKTGYNGADYDFYVAQQYQQKFNFFDLE